MLTISATKARARLNRLIEEAAETHEPIEIKGKRNKVILIAKADWRAIQETLNLLSNRGVRSSIRRGLATPLSRTSAKPGW